MKNICVRTHKRCTKTQAQTNTCIVSRQGHIEVNKLTESRMSARSVYTYIYIFLCVYTAYKIEYNIGTRIIWNNEINHRHRATQRSQLNKRQAHYLKPNKQWILSTQKNRFLYSSLLFVIHDERVNVYRGDLSFHSVMIWSFDSIIQWRGIETMRKYYSNKKKKNAEKNETIAICAKCIQTICFLCVCVCFSLILSRIWHFGNSNVISILFRHRSISLVHECVWRLFYGRHIHVTQLIGLEF